MVNAFKRMWSYRKELVVADHRIDLMSMMLWLLLGTWGILSTVQHVTILNSAFEWYPIVWGSSIAVAALGAFVGAMMIFVVNPLDYERRIRWKRLELSSVIALFGLITVYPALMFVSMFDGVDAPRPDLVVLALSYLCVPGWRIGHLVSRITGLRVLLAKKKGLI